MRSTTAVRSYAGVLRNQLSSKYAGQMGFVKSGRAAEPPIPLLTIDATEPAEPQPQGGRYRWSEAGLWAWEDLNLGLILIRTVRGMRSCWSSGDGQLMGGARVTVVVRWAPGLSVRCGTRVARPARRNLTQGPAGAPWSEQVRGEWRLQRPEPARERSKALNEAVRDMDQAMVDARLEFGVGLIRGSSDIPNFCS
jgi:hypothetical protein